MAVTLLLWRELSVNPVIISKPYADVKVRIG